MFQKIIIFYKRIKKTIYFSLGQAYEIMRLPKVEFSFDKSLLEFDNVKNAFNYFTKQHPKLIVVKNKQIGVAHINLHEYTSSENYLAAINGKNSAYYYARKCRARRYELHKIERNKFVKEIALIESSKPVRQGRPMTNTYGNAEAIYMDNDNCQYYGVMLDAGVDPVTQYHR